MADLSGGLTGLLPKGFEAALDTQKDPGAVKALAAACDAAYDAYTTSCSHAVNAVIRDRLYAANPDDWPQRDANTLIGHLNGSTGWVKVTLDRAYELAQQGIVVVGGKTETGHGHVIVVYPGLKQPRGGYSATDKAGKPYTVAKKGEFPRAMSASLGSWPGAKSRGDKTVWDPWANDTNFALVKFWAPTSKSAATASVSGRLAAMVRRTG